MNEDIIFPPSKKDLPFNITLCGTSYCDGSYHIKRKVAELTCVEYIISGEGVIHCDAKTEYPQKGDMYILPKGSCHDYYSDSENPWVKIWVNIEGELATQILSAYAISRNILFKNCDGSAYIRRMHDICRNQSLSAFEIQSACAKEFFALVQLLYKKTTEYAGTSDADIIREYIDRNADRSINIIDMSEVISKSASQTIRIFKKAYGITPYEYLLNQKIAKAKLLLKGSNISVKKISASLSFSDEHYFSGLFKKRTGMSPSEYRRYTGV